MSGFRPPNALFLDTRQGFMLRAMDLFNFRQYWGIEGANSDRDATVAKLELTVPLIPNSSAGI